MKRHFLFAILTLGLSACATQRKVEALQSTEKAPNGVRVQLGSSDHLDAGQRVQFYSYTCKMRKVASLEPYESCSKIQNGDGEVAEILNESQSIVQPDPGVQVTRDMYVEKKRN